MMAIPTITTTIDDDDQEEGTPLNSASIDDRIIALVRGSRGGNDGDDGRRTIRPAHLASELGLSIEEATRELCILLSAVGGGNDGASFEFERVGMPSQTPKPMSNAMVDRDDDVAMSKETTTTTTTTTMTMAFSFPADFEERAMKNRRKSDLSRRLRVMSRLIVRALKIFAAFGLVISLAVLIIACICLLVAAVIAMTRGGGGGGGRGGDGGRGNQYLMRKLRYLFFQLRQVLWLYAICGSGGVGSNQDPFLREVAGDLAMMMSVCANPYHPFFWMRLGGMRRRWGMMTRGGGDVSRSRGLDGGLYYADSRRIDGIAMMRRGTWRASDDDDGDEVPRPMRLSFDRSGDDQRQQRGLLSIAVEFLFGPDKTPSSVYDDRIPSTTSELDKWKFRARVIISLSSKSPGYGVSLRDLLPFVDDPPASLDDPSALSETLRMVTYFNGRPAGNDGEDGEDRRSGMNARFCFPELVAEFDCHSLLSLGSSVYAPPASFDNDSDAGNVSSILYKEEGGDYTHGPSIDTSDDTPKYLHEKPYVVTDLTRQQFGQCVLLGLLNYVGIVWIQNATMPGGLMELPVPGNFPRSSTAGSTSSLIVIASFFVLKLLNTLRFYAGFFISLPLCRLVIVLIRNYACRKRNERRRKFVTSDM
ncbi:hypothetical protein ACHAXA_002779 [Cyclostephanos tholiformis]|uniref:Uncharacterized protein n=1 Tax=Cyclostephanos tholiformis TaxID=382380 RepID=A0ABD3RGB8_9STRA